DRRAKAAPEAGFRASRSHAGRMGPQTATRRSRHAVLRTSGRWSRPDLHAYRTVHLALGQCVPGTGDAGLVAGDLAHLDHGLPVARAQAAELGSGGEGFARQALGAGI